MSKGPRFRSRYNYGETLGFDTGSGSQVQQSAKDECDINLIMAKFRKLGPDALKRYADAQPGRFGDFDMVTDYHTALNSVRAAEEAFSELPSAVRARFANDPGNFMDAIENPGDGSLLVELGLAKLRTPVPSEAPDKPVVKSSGKGTPRTSSEE